MSTCSICNGRRVIDQDGELLECTCALQERIGAYLGPYLSGNYAEKVTPKHFGNPPLILLNGAAPDSVHNFFRSWLINTGLTKTWRKLHAYDIMQAYLSRSDGDEENPVETFIDLANIPIVLLELKAEPPNRSYFTVLQAFFERRNDPRFTTIVSVPKSVTHPDFTKTYGNEMQPYLLNPPFKTIKLTSRAAA